MQHLTPPPSRFSSSSLTRKDLSLTWFAAQLASSQKIIAGIAEEDKDIGQRNYQMLKAITDLKNNSGKSHAADEVTEVAS
jgi:hypothetical protein